MILEKYDINTANIKDHADEVAGFLKGIANPHRLAILCQMMKGEKSVSALMEATGMAQTSMSQHLKKLRDEGIVDYRRDHRTLNYFINNESVVHIMGILHGEFCAREGDKKDDV